MTNHRSSLSGVDFKKGCFIGQEVVSRMRASRHGAQPHRAGHPRRRPRPKPAATIMAGDKQVGTMGSSAGQDWVWRLVRVDRVTDALDAGLALTAGGLPLRLADPDCRPHHTQTDRRMSRTARLHPDGKTRCPWPGEDPFYVAYHDNEWGVPEYDDRALFEKLILDGFQAGLSWITILRKRDNFRKAFDDFEPEKIARYTDKKVACADERRRHRAQPRQDRRHGLEREGLPGNHGEGPGLLEIPVGLRRRQAEGQPVQDHRERAGLDAGLDQAISKELGARGFKFVGPTIVYAFMQATGMVNDHLVTCHCHENCSGKLRTPRLKKK
jgi:DNA-3-methyladenine glycosylase I